MRLYTLIEKSTNKEILGASKVDNGEFYPISQFGIEYKTMNDLIKNITDAELSLLQNKLDKSEGYSYRIQDVQLCAPIPVLTHDMICLGINYMAHAEESARYKAEAFGGDRPFAVYFSKRVNKATADGEAIPAYAEIVDSLDYESELAVVIGKDAKNVSEEDAFNYVFGYTIVNDVSARNLQTQHKQWYFGKSLDGFTPMGPAIVTKEEFSNPPELGIRSYVNGELRQNSNTNLLIFGIAHVISELSQGMTLEAGTVISMGTPAGVGMGFVPPKFLKAGDVVKCEIEGIGSITNTVE